jgi:hypothetical protein
MHPVFGYIPLGGEEGQMEDSLTIYEEDRCEHRNIHERKKRVLQI